MQQVIFPYCIYTIAHRDKLAKAASKMGVAKFSEAKAWRTGYDLWNQAQAAGAVMVVVFADATDCSRLLFWGTLTDIVIKDKTTWYSLRELRKIKGDHATQELLLRSTGKAIAPNFIRPYAICRTPPFLGSI